MTAAPAERPRILCVDDEPAVLDGLRRRLRDRFEVRVATSGAAGLAALADDGPFAVVVSDMRMPAMDGAVFLQHVRERAADTVRILLTGYGDVESLAAAVNQGNIFRLLTKPCPPDVLRATLDAGVRLHRELSTAGDQQAHLLLELKAAEGVKEAFLACVSHELRTPLNIILGYAELLRDGGVGPLTAAQQDVVGRLEGQAFDLYRLLGQVLLARDIVTDRAGIRVRCATLRETARTVERALESLERPPPVAVAPSLGDMVVTDPGGVAIVVRYLVEHLVATTPHARLAVRLECDCADLLLGIVGAEEVVAGALRPQGDRLGPGLIAHCLRQLGGQIQYDDVAGRERGLWIRFTALEPSGDGRSAPRRPSGGGGAAASGTT